MKSMKNLFTNLAKSALLLLLISFFYQGCTDDTVSSGPTYDTIAVNFNNLIVSERIPPFDSAFSSVDLYHGAVIQEYSTLKDAVLVDSAQASENFYFRSGHLSVDMPAGFQTRFSEVFQYRNITQGQWDTIKVIPDSDTNLTPDDFTLNETPSFREPLNTHPVFGFYLAGRYLNYSVYHVYGMIYIDSVWRDNGVFKAKIDVKINKKGENRLAVN